MSFPLVKHGDYGIRPAGKPDQCFYCYSKIGQPHRADCVVVTKRVKIKATITIDIEVPHDWDKKMIEFHRNDGTWCSSNFANDVERYKASTGSCMCQETKIEFVEVVDDTPLVTDGKLRSEDDE